MASITSKPTLDGVYSKVIRAHQKFVEFHSILGEFIESRPYLIRVHADTRPSTYQFTVEFKPFPPELAILAGEFAHNLRGALDHLAWQLVIDFGKTPNANTTFPLWSKARVDSRSKHQLMPGIIPGVFPDVGAFVLNVQPYFAVAVDPHHAPLAWLARMNNVDKHHQLYTVFGSILDADYAIHVGSTGTILKRGRFNGPIDSGTNLTTVTYTGDPRELDVELSGVPAVSLDVEGDPLILTRRTDDGLRQILGVTVEAVILPLIPMLRNLT